MGFPGGTVDGNLVVNAQGFSPWSGRIPYTSEQVLLPGGSQGRGSLVGCRLWGCTESDMTEAT